MKNQKQTIRKIVGFINNPEEEGGFWLPNIQRPFVWSEDQIARLFDSIMRDYPISTLLIWKTTSGLKRRKFIDNWRDTLRLGDFYVPEDDKKKCLVLDGQQRLQSLYIALVGSYEGKEFYFDILSGDMAAPDDVKYQFKFMDSRYASFPWFKLKDLVFTTKRKRELADDLKAASRHIWTDQELDRLDDNLELIDRAFKQEEVVTYQELDSIDNPRLYTEEDVVEVFIRANAGGTKLGRSDLMISLLTAAWEFADEQMEILLESLNQHGFSFERDFILKTCLVLIGQGAKYKVEKFRKPGVRSQIEAEWDAMSAAVKDVLDFIRGKTFIQCDRALPSYLALTPLIYVRYRYPESWKTARDIDRFLLRCLLAGAFSGYPDALLDAMVVKIDQIRGFNADDLYDVIRSQGRSLELTETRFWQMGYSSAYIHLIFNLWYRDFNHTPAYDNNWPQIDHIFPQSLLKAIKLNTGQSGRQIMKYRDRDRNQLANCMLLTREENGAGGKCDAPPSEWFKRKDDAYLDRHLIPKDQWLWKRHNYEAFIEERQKLIRERFRYLLVSASGEAA